MTVLNLSARRLSVFVGAVFCGMIASAALPGAAQAQKHLPGNAAMGATAGFLVGGPIGAVAGGAVGFLAGEDIARGTGIKRPYRRYWVDSYGRRHYYRR